MTAKELKKIWDAYQGAKKVNDEIEALWVADDTENVELENRFDQTYKIMMNYFTELVNGLQAFTGIDAMTARKMVIMMPDRLQTIFCRA